MITTPHPQSSLPPRLAATDVPPPCECSSFWRQDKRNCLKVLPFFFFFLAPPAVQHYDMNKCTTAPDTQDKGDRCCIAGDHPINDIKDR